MLIDPQFLEQLKVDREFKQIQKPADSVGRANLSLDIGKTLNDDTLSDDQKVKRYLQTLNRYNQVTASTSKSNPLTEVVAKKKRDVRLGCRTRMSYVDPQAPGSFDGIQNVRRYGGQVKDLSRKDAYTLHKWAWVRFRRRKTYSMGPRDIFHIDLVDLVNISSHNDGYRYILTSLRNERGRYR